TNQWYIRLRFFAIKCSRSSWLQVSFHRYDYQFDDNNFRIRPIVRDLSTRLNCKTSLAMFEDEPIATYYLLSHPPIIVPTDSLLAGWLVHTTWYDYSSLHVSTKANKQLPPLQIIMDRFKKHKLFRSRLSTAVIVPTTSNLVLATAEIVLPTQIVTDEIPDPHPVDPLGLSLAFSIAGFKTLQEVAEVIPVAGGPLKAICSILICILQAVKVPISFPLYQHRLTSLLQSCKKNREGWEKLSDIIKEKNKCILALLELYSKAPMEYPSAESQAREYQQ
ncbi:hypothetical protein FRC18_007641, partial [Serendipita sp. 400]